MPLIAIFKLTLTLVLEKSLIEVSIVFEEFLGLYSYYENNIKHFKSSFSLEYEILCNILVLYNILLV